MSWDRVERLIGKDNLELLANTHICVVGLGSGGGFVAQSLAMSGVGKFTLVDDDTLEASNVVRHVADRRDLGRPKAEVVADLIKQRNPNAEVDVRIGRVENNMDALDNCDLLVVGVDGEGSKYVLNEACVERDLTAVYAGVYERGEGGDVVIIRPGNGPCYACWAAELREGMFQANPQSEDLDYGMINESGTLEAEPALWLHVVKVAAIQTDFVINELLSSSTGTGTRQPFPGNTIIIANSAMEIIEGQINEPHTAVWVNISRDPNCLVCGDLINSEQNEDGSDISLEDLADNSGIMIEDDNKDNDMLPHHDDDGSQHLSRKSSKG